MAVLFSDDFNRADSTDLGPDWIEDTQNSEIVSNQLLCFSGASGGSNRLVTNSSFAADVKVSVDYISNSGSLQVAGPIARHADASNYYYVRWAGNAGIVAQRNRLAIVKVVAGVSTLLATEGSTRTISSGDKISIQCIGDQISALLNDAVILTATDSALTGGGKCGILSNITTVSGTTRVIYDDFLVEGFGQSSLLKIMQAHHHWNNGARE